MTGFTPGGNSALDKALDIISPHSGENLGSIGIEEFEKILSLIARKRHLAFELLHLYGTEELIQALWKSGKMGSGHRLKYSTRIDVIFEMMEKGTKNTFDTRIEN